MRTTRLITAALLALAVGLGGCGDTGAGTDQDTDQAAEPAPRETPASGPFTEIPGDFPLGLGMTSDAEVDLLATSDVPRIRGFAFCGTDPLVGPEPTDVRNVDNSGGEAFDTRDLRLFATPGEARAMVTTISDLARGCPEQDDEGGLLTERTEVRPSPLAASPSLLLVQRYATDGDVGPDVMVTHVVLAGNAVLMARTYAQTIGQDVDEILTGTTTALRRTVAAMAVFDSGTTPAPDAETSPAAAPPVIPPDFRLGVELPNDGGDFRVEPAASTSEVFDGVTVCGTDVWPVTGTAGGTARLVTTAAGPEWFDVRDLVAYADHEVAQDVMATLRQAGTCGEFDNQVWHDLAGDTGYDTVTLGLSYSDGLGSSTFQWTRVGSAVVLVMASREGTAEGLARHARELTGTSRTIAEEMCVFSVAGC